MAQIGFDLPEDPMVWGTNPGDYWQQGGKSPWQDFPQPGMPTVDRTPANPAGAQEPQQAAPWWITNDYWAPDREQVLRDPTRWGTDPTAPKTQAQSPFNAEAFGQAWVASGGRTNQDWINFFNSHPEAAQAGYRLNDGAKPGKLLDPNGGGWDTVIASGEGGKGASFTRLNPGGAAGGPGGSATDLYTNEILSRLEALRQPVNSPLNTLLQLFALNRVNDLNGAPYTNADDAAMIARYRATATQARDAALERAKEDAARRGYLPSSGLYRHTVNDIEGQYQQGIAHASNDLAVRAVDQKKQNAQEQLAILASLMGNETAQRQEDYGRGADLVQTAGLLPQLEERRLGELLQASDSGNAAQGQGLQALLSVLGMNQNQSYLDQQNRNQNAAAWGQYLAWVLGQI